MVMRPTWRTTKFKINEDNIEEFKAKAIQGDAELQYVLGRYYFRRKNYHESRKWVIMAAELGNV